MGQEAPCLSCTESQSVLVLSSPVSGWFLCPKWGNAFSAPGHYGLQMWGHELLRLICDHVEMSLRKTNHLTDDGWVAESLSHSIIKYSIGTKFKRLKHLFRPYHCH